MSAARQQQGFFRGVYEFEDPSGGLLAAKVPAVGSADLYDGTAIIVRPHQCALFIYEGQLTDVFFAGSHRVQTENLPVLTRLANWKFGFQSPLRAELVFVSGHVLTGRRWGTPQPVIVSVQGLGSAPIRAFGHFNLAITDPKAFYLKLMGSRISFSVTDLDDFIQGQIVEMLPRAIGELESFEQLNAGKSDLSRKLEILFNREMKQYGLSLQKLQILSALPSKEVIEALDAKMAIQMIGSQKEYLLYKAANSLLNERGSSGNDPMQMMMGLMLGKGLMGADYHQKEQPLRILNHQACPSCQAPIEAQAKFCSQCGAKIE